MKDFEIEVLTEIGLVKPVRTVAFSPAGSRLAAAGDARVIALYDVQHGEQVANLTGHSAWIFSVDWSDTGFSTSFIFPLSRRCSSACSARLARKLFWITLSFSLHGSLNMLFISALKLAHATALAMESLPCTQYGHNKCALLTFPHAEHLFKAVKSFSAFPAYCLCLFFIWDVFFFGTAFSIDSHNPSTRPGIFSCIADGRANCNEGSSGRESCRE